MLTDIFFAALHAVDPYKAVELHIPRIRATYKHGGFSEFVLVAFGKAAFLMAKAVSDLLPDLITKGIVITKYGHVPPGNHHNNIKVFEAGHPIPDLNGFTATKKVITMLDQADAKTLVVCLISGGGSALLVAPKGGISLDDKQGVTAYLLKAGATINELNTVRKHLSDVKGGRLAGLAYPARLLSLILSDVIGDRLDMIASGPTSPDGTTYRMALDVLGKYRGANKIAGRVTEVLQGGLKGVFSENPKEADKVFEKVENIIVGSNVMAARAAEARAIELGFATRTLSNELQGEAREVARWIAKKAMEAKASLPRKDRKKICLISGGETTVTVKGSGKGGRNTELALAFALAIQGIQGISLLSAGTDGTDGPTDAAGAIVDGETVTKAGLLGLSASDCLANNDSYSFFRETGELLITGPTGTNVMDLQIILVE